MYWLAEIFDGEEAVIVPVGEVPIEQMIWGPGTLAEVIRWARANGWELWRGQTHAFRRKAAAGQEGQD